jgi:hypothetical protein
MEERQVEYCCMIGGVVGPTLEMIFNSDRSHDMEELSHFNKMQNYVALE